MSGALEALGDLVERRRGRVIAVWAVVVAVSVALLPRFTIDPNVAALLPEDHPDVAALVGVDALDPASRDLVIVLRDARLAEDAERLDALVARLRAAPEVERIAATRAAFLPSSAGGAPLWGLAREDLDALEARLGDEGRRRAIRESRELLRDDPFLGRDVVARDPLGLRWALDPERAGPLAGRLRGGTDRVVLAQSGALLVRATARSEPFDQAATARLIHGIRDALDGVPHDLVGGHAIAFEDATRIRGDMIRSTSTSVPLVLIFLVASLGSFALAHVVLVPVLVAVVGALGLGGAALGPLPALAVASAAILVGLGVDFALHVVTRLAAERERGERGATARMLRGTGSAVLAGGGTSIAAFLAFAATSIDGLARFGLLLTIGLALAVLASLTLVPALGARLAPGRTGPGPVMARIERVVRGPWRYAMAAAVLVVAVALGIVAAARGVRFDAGPRFLRPADSVARAATERLAGELGFAPAALVVLAPEGEAEAAPEGGAAASQPPALYAAGARLLADGDAGLVTGAAAAIADPGRARRIEAFRERTAGWVDAALGDLAEAGFAAERLRPVLEEQAARLALDPARAPAIQHAGASWQRSSVHPAAPPATREERARLRAAVRAAFPSDSRLVDPYGLGDALGPTLARSLRRAVLAAGAAIAVVVLLALRRPVAALVAVLPCVAALSVTLGVLALADWPIHPGNLAALPLVLGLGVDDGLHLVLRYREPEAAGTPLGTTGRAIWRTSVTTILGFGSLAFSATPALRSLGVIVGLGTAAAFVATVMLVPLLVSDESRSGRAGRDMLEE